MKLLLIGSDKDLFNPESAVSQRIIKYAQAAGHISVIVFNTGIREAVMLSDQAKVYPTNSLNKYLSVFDAVKIGSRLIKEQGIEVVSTQDPFEAGLAGLLLKSNLNIALNVQIHGDFFSTKYYWRRSLLDKIRLQIAKKVLPAADSVRVVSQRIALSLAKFKISKTKIMVAPIFVDTARPAEQHITIDLHREFPNKFVILSVGRLVKEKNLGMLIEAAGQLVKNGQQVGLAIVGQGSEEASLKLKTQNLKLEGVVRFYGWQENLGTFYRTADCLAITSQAEGYNRTAIEAMACGLPVIMTDVGLAGETVKDKVNGLIIKQSTVIELADKIKELMQNQNLRNQLSVAALKTVQSLPTQEENLALYVKSWQSALENHGQK